MTAFSTRNVLPAATLLAATFFLAGAIPHVLLREPAAATSSSPRVVRAEVQVCVAGGRTQDECLEEVAGKAVIQRAEWLARSGAQEVPGRAEEPGGVVEARSPPPGRAGEP